MDKFKLQARVTREVIDTMTLQVLAESSEEAIGKAKQLLSGKPSSAPDIPYCYIENRENKAPTSLEITEDYDDTETA